MPTGTVLVTGGSGYLVCVVQAACLLVVCRVLESVICSLRGCRAAGAVPGGGLVSRRIQGGLHALLQRRAGAGGRRHSTPGGPGLRRWAGRVPARPGAAARRGELRGGVLARGLRARPCGGTVRASRPLSAADGVAPRTRPEPTQRALAAVRSTCRTRCWPRWRSTPRARAGGRCSSSCPATRCMLAPRRGGPRRTRARR